jgi:hypothetical protein
MLCPTDGPKLSVEFELRWRHGVSLFHNDQTIRSEVKERNDEKLYWIRSSRTQDLLHVRPMLYHINPATLCYTPPLDG